jgi:site-specific recombinase XerD
MAEKTALTVASPLPALRQPLPADKHPAATYLGNLSKSGRVTMRGSLNEIASLISSGQHDAQSLNWAALRFQHTQAIRTALAERFKAATCNKMLSALRGVLKQAWLLGYMTAEDYQKAIAIRNVPGTTLPRGRELSHGEIAALMSACMKDTAHEGTRDAALLATAYAAGLRRAEVVALDLEDFDPEKGSLRIRGKRNRERIAYVDNGALMALRDWLSIRGKDTGPLFWPSGEGKGRPLVNRRMVNQSVYDICKHRAEQAGIEDFSPHDLRRSFVSHLLSAGADIAVVSRMAGHRSLNTTSIYDMRGLEAQHSAAKLLHVPYRSRQERPKRPTGK